MPKRPPSHIGPLIDRYVNLADRLIQTLYHCNVTACRKAVVVGTGRFGKAIYSIGIKGPKQSYGAAWVRTQKAKDSKMMTNRLSARSDNKEWRQDRRGVTSLEYGLIAGLLVVAILVGFDRLGHQLQSHFDQIGLQADPSSGLPQSIPAAGLTAIIADNDD